MVPITPCRRRRSSADDLRARQRRARRRRGAFLARPLRSHAPLANTPRRIRAAADGRGPTGAYCTCMRAFTIAGMLALVVAHAPAVAADEAPAKAVAPVC